jgi:filamentous hemagglutinin
MKRYLNSLKKSFLDNYYYTAETLEDFRVFRRFGGGPSQAKLFGGFSSTEAVLNRSELAILKKWSTMQFEAELQIERGAKLNLGRIASQSVYSGGADQVLLPLGYPENWIKSIKDLKTGIIYSLEDFKITFPDQIK